MYRRIALRGKSSSDSSNTSRSSSCFSESVLSGKNNQSKDVAVSNEKPDTSMLKETSYQHSLDESFKSSSERDLVECTEQLHREQMFADATLELFHSRDANPIIATPNKTLESYCMDDDRTLSPSPPDMCIWDDFFPKNSSGNRNRKFNNEQRQNDNSNKPRVLQKAYVPSKLPENDNYMIRILSDCGLIMDDSFYAFKLNTDQALFVRDVTTAITSDKSYVSRSTELFIMAFDSYFAHNSNLMKALSPCETEVGCDIARGHTQDSLIRLLLQVDVFQPKISKFLMDKLAAFSIGDENIGECEDALTWVRMLLQPFRFLNHLVDSKKLSEQLVDIIVTASVKMIQQEIIICLPDIIGDNEHHFVAVELSKLLRSELKQLLPSILDALGSLSMQSEVRSEVRLNLILCLRRAPLEFLSSIVQFLLSTCDKSSFEEVISGLRIHLYFNLGKMHGGEEFDAVSLQISKIIRSSFLGNKPLMEDWLRHLEQIDNPSNHNPIDVIVMIILNDICKEQARKKIVETAFVNRVKRDLFQISLVKKTLKTFMAAVKQYFPSLMDILSVMLKDSLLAEYTGAFYSACFESVEGYWVKKLMNNLLVYIGAGGGNNAAAAFIILSDVAISQGEKIRPMASSLSILLNKFVDLPLGDAHELMDFLCCVAYSSGEDYDTCTLKDEIDILVQKYLCSCNIKMLRYGVVAAVMAIKHTIMCSQNEPNDECPKGEVEAEKIKLSDRGKKALPLFKLIMEGTRTAPEVQGLFLDQFSVTLLKCNTKAMDKTFLAYLSATLKEDLELNFLTYYEGIVKTDVIKCDLQFSLRANVKDGVILNLTNTLAVEKNSNCNRWNRKYTLILSPLFRLIRVLDSEDLEGIDGLLECGVVLPSPKVLEDFSIISPGQQIIVIDSLFHLVNWFREVVNCFAPSIRTKGEKVLMRLRAIIWLQNLISELLPDFLSPDYQPPLCQFDNGTSSKPKIPHILMDKKSKSKENKKGKLSLKRKRGGNKADHQSSILEEEIEDDTTAIVSIAQKGKKETRVVLKDYNNFFRDLDTNIWALLQTKMTMNPESMNPKEWRFTPQLGPMELKFILEDLVAKAGEILAPISNSKFSSKTFASTRIMVNTPHNVIKTLTKLMKALAIHLESLAKYCRNLLSANGGILDASGMYLGDSNEIRDCYALVLRTFALFFSWIGFKDLNNESIIVEGMKRVVDRSKEFCKGQDAREYAHKCAAYLMEFEDSIVTLECAFYLAKILDALTHYQPMRDVEKATGTICYNFLQHRWFDRNGQEEKGSVFNQRVEYLLTMFFNTGSDKLKSVATIADHLKDEVSALNGKDKDKMALKTLPNINKTNCGIFFRVLLRALLEGIRSKCQRDDLDSKGKLTAWFTVMKTLEIIVGMVKSQTTNNNLICFIKGSSPILRLFLAKGMPVCSIEFRAESVNVSLLFKTLQITTRFIQKVFDDTKINEKAALTRHVPSIRSLLETLLLKVKGIIVINRCTKAFFLGSMRNKDLKGEEINSQSTIGDEFMELDEEEDQNGDRNEDESRVEKKGKEDEHEEIDFALKNGGENENCNNSDMELVSILQGSLEDDEIINIPPPKPRSERFSD